MRTGIRLVYGIFFTNRSSPPSFLAPDTDVHQVHDLVSVSRHCGGATCGPFILVTRSHCIHVNLLQVFLILDLNGVSLSASVQEWY